MTQPSPSIDATAESGRLGRIVYHSEDFPNCKAKQIIADDGPKLYLETLEDIPAGQEILYEYGERHAEFRREFRFLKSWTVCATVSERLGTKRTQP